MLKKPLGFTSLYYMLVSNLKFKFQKKKLQDAQL